MTSVSAEAPSNIALIKYMGKRVNAVSAQANLPLNASLSLTLPEFRTRVEISDRDKSESDQIVPFSEGPWLAPALSARGEQKFLNFFSNLKQHWNIPGQFTIRSANNFPSDCGVASSASSFAALTLATYELAKHFNSNLDLNVQDLAQLSRQGSGSSCRSFSDGFVQWENQDVKALDLGIDFKHELILVDQGHKEVSSSDAHRRVGESSMFVGRPERAEKRLQDLLHAFSAQDWSAAWQTTWDEFWDMHLLFHTSKPPFRYMTEKTTEVLEVLRKQFAENGDGPLVTMDAGANIHLLYRPDQASVWPTLNAEVEGLTVMVGRKVPS